MKKRIVLTIDERLLTVPDAMNGEYIVEPPVIMFRPMIAPMKQSEEIMLQQFENRLGLTSAKIAHKIQSVLNGEQS